MQVSFTAFVILITHPECATNHIACLSEHFDTFRKEVILHCHLSQILQDSLYFDAFCKINLEDIKVCTS